MNVSGGKAMATPLTMMDVRSTMPNGEEKEFWQANYWDAVAGRDARMDGVFLYAVVTTGVYCKPSCPSRRPRPENVVFFRTQDAAERAGFRACKRCRPDARSASNANADLVEKVCRYIDAHPDGPATLQALSRSIGLSPFHLQRTFKALTGITPRAYADTRRLQALKTGLRNGHSVTRSLYDAGYGSSSRLYEGASSKLGMTPARYGKQGSGVAIRYAIAKTPIGRMLLAATGKGICSVQFGESDVALEGELRREYPRAEIARSDKALARWVRAIQGRIRGENAEALPLDIQATAFQRLVWEQLRQIPYGDTRSYGEVARRIGRPKAARAVARACASNPVAVAIPCHRVVRENGDPGGYRWGMRRKQNLLALERGAG
jgi:AraC family transcriptional regulator, regulatory protein of adaptative response / methylated-DNA-[protein]-cysteine methyltransferase